jgi:NAD(P)-dependent dehydrogenase (short-subunit alcohol dehydrogenase family)
VSALVNNAGFEVRGPIEQISDESYRRQFDTNVLGVIRMVRAFAPQMRARGSGVIVNLSSR